MSFLTGIKQFVESVDKEYMRRVKRASEIVEYGMHHHGHGHDDDDTHEHNDAHGHSHDEHHRHSYTNADTQKEHQHHADDVVKRTEPLAPMGAEQQEQAEEDDEEGTVISNVPLGTRVPRSSRPEQEKN